MRSRTIVLLALLALLWFGGLGQRSLIHPDEGRYAEIPREMLATGDWLTPRLNAIKYFEKPPLQYWATATGFAAFGLSEWSARLWPALTGFLTALLVAFTGRRLFGRDAGIAAGVITLGNIYFFAMGQVITLDMGLTFFMTAMLCATLIAQSGMGSRRRWMLLAWASAALAMLSKGLIALALPGAALVLFTLVARDPAIWRRLEIGWGLVVFLLIAAPWFIVVSIVNPEFPEFFFLHEHFARFTGDTFYAHMDEEAARANPLFGGRVAHGYLILAFAAGLFVDPDPGPVLANYGLDALRFVKPVFIGDTIQARLTCKRKTDRNKRDAQGHGQGVVAWDVEVSNQRGELVASYDILTLVAKRG